MGKYLKTKDCGTCEGEGEIEDVTYYGGEEYGYNTIAEGNGKMIPCPDCREDYYEHTDDSDRRDLD